MRTYVDKEIREGVSFVSIALMLSGLLVGAAVATVLL
jgi:hypothetical protein